MKKALTYLAPAAQEGPVPGPRVTGSAPDKGTLAAAVECAEGHKYDKPGDKKLSLNGGGSSNPGSGSY